MGRGGFRVGRRHSSVERCHELTAWGAFRYAHDENDGVRVSWEMGDDGVLQLRHSRDRKKHETQIHLVETPCNFGGSRQWFLCPRCCRRVGKIYLPLHIVDHAHRRLEAWGCRHCYCLTYEQRQQRNLSDVYEWRAERIATRYFRQTKKMVYHRKGLHQKTFEKQYSRYIALYEKSNEHDIRRWGPIFQFLAPYLPKS